MTATSPPATTSETQPSTTARTSTTTHRVTTPPENQCAQTDVSLRDDDEPTTHGDANIYHLTRRVHFDLGDHYDLVDVTTYGPPWDLVQRGRESTRRLIGHVRGSRSCCSRYTP